MTFATETERTSVAKLRRHRRRRRKKMGRPTVRKDGVPLTTLERVRRCRAKKTAKVKAAKKKAVLFSVSQWYTPKHVVRAVRKVFGGTIDCDPASCDMAQRVVKAKVYYTIDNDGLNKSWHGKVLLKDRHSS